MTDYIDATLALPKNAPLAALIAAEDSPAPCALSGLGSHDDCGERDAANMSLPESIALALTGTTDPRCELCGAPAFVTYSGRLLCKPQWQHGTCAGNPHIYIAPDPIAVLEDEFRADVDDYITQRQEAAIDRNFAFQSPNLRTRLDLAIRQARAATSRVDRREWTEEAQSLVERLVDAAAVCECGVAYNAITGHCDDCVAKQEQLAADHRRFGVMSLDIDESCGF
jgi:hypothetical protein